MNRFAVFTAVKTYAGKIRTIRNEVRTRRFLNTLPHSIQNDIGWPDIYDERPRPRF